MFTNFDKAWIPGVIVTIVLGMLASLGIAGDMSVEEAVGVLVALVANGIAVYFTPNKA